MATETARDAPSPNFSLSKSNLKFVINSQILISIVRMRLSFEFFTPSTVLCENPENAVIIFILFFKRNIKKTKRMRLRHNAKKYQMEIFFQVRRHRCVEYKPRYNMQYVNI
jgi:hypothetical protein